MASGNTLCVFRPQMSQPPTSAYATRDTRNSHVVLDFDDSTIESALWEDILPRNYAAGGITVTIVWMATTATANDVVWGASFERHQDETDDLDSDTFAAEQTATGTCAGTSGQPQYTDITFTDGAQIDSLAAGESFRLKIRRVASDGADTMVGDAEILSVEVSET